MYQRANKHTELNRLISAMAVSRQFRQVLMQNPERALAQGYLGHRFNLTAEERKAVVSAAEVKNARQFSLRLWAWMNCQARENDSPPWSRPSQSNRLLDKTPRDIHATTRAGSTKKESVMHRLFATQFAYAPTNRRAKMNPLVLVVDDNREMVEGLRYALEMEGFRVAHAFNGEGAVRFLEQNHPNLILSDIKMPRMDGYALLRVVKETAAWADIPFIFVTAAADWREAVLAKSLGAEEYVVKPFELEDLMEVVRRLTQTRDPAEIETDQEMKQRTGKDISPGF